MSIGEAPFVTFSKWAFKYGHEGISYVRFGTVRVAIVSDAKLAQQMCVRMADNFSSRPSGLFVARVLKDKGPCYVLDNIIIEPNFFIDKDILLSNLDESIQSTGNVYVTQNNRINVCYFNLGFESRPTEQSAGSSAHQTRQRHLLA